MNTKALLQELKTSVLAILILAILLCGIYPVVVWGIAQLVFPRQANGSLINPNGRIIGSSLIGQPFSGERYFHPRPSAAGSDGYDATSSGGSNFGPLSQKLMGQVKERVSAYRTENNTPAGVPIPADAVTASASGLDPHISVKNAELQAARVARARNIHENDIRETIRKFTEGPDLGFLGDSGVNVLKLNLALDALTGKPNGGQ
jgi:potassium-transporting ATPase KdpC subunit